ncbi:MAG: glycine cleavage system aminomethyltransferase GcvT [Bacteriovoracaceae bacterium]|nr:glycine cleavage system aminomethyltransferase GcvT [Bacteriovoracaceae bacterium]
MNKVTLYDSHKKLNAKFAPFAGWDMPIQYQNVKDEVLAVRNAVGVFDVSHMGEFFVEGPDTYAFLDYLLPNDISGAAMGKAIYSPLCREDGSIVDDLIVYKLDAEKALVCVNASNIEKDFLWFQKFLKGYNCTLTNQSDKYSLLAIQGPHTIQTLKKLGWDDADLGLEYYACIERADYIIARTGYTGEDGFEIFCSHQFVQELWDKLMELNVKPCGLAARDVLRLEVCYPLYGHELSDEVTPLDSALKWTIKSQKNSYVGKEALEKYKPKSKLIKLTLEKGIPRADYNVLNDKQEVIGKVTSGTLSIILNQGIAIARVDLAKANQSSLFYVAIRDKLYEAKETKKPFVTGGHL